MKKLLFCSILVLTGCASQLAARDCENLGYIKGSPEFIACAERQLASRHEAKLEKSRQEAQIAVEHEKASQGLFGRAPVCNTSSYGSGVYSQNCK